MSGRPHVDLEASLDAHMHPLAYDDPGPIPTEPQIREPRPFGRSTPRPVTRRFRRELIAAVDPRALAYDGPSPLDGSITDALLETGHSCLDCRTAYGREQRVSPWPLIAYALVLIAIGLALGILAGSALASTPHTATSRGPSTAAAADPIETRLVLTSTLTTIPNETAAAAREERGYVTTDTRVSSLASRSMSREGGPQGGRFIGSKDSGTAGPSGGPNTPPATTAVIAAAATRYSLDPAYLIAIARCESGLDVLAVGRAQELGVFQWKPTSWQLASRLSGRGYGIERIFDVDAQADLAAWAISSGYASWWSCAS